MTHTEMIEYLRSQMATRLSAALTAAGIPDMDDYIGQTPFDSSRRQLAVFLGEGERNRDEHIEGFLIQLVLPREEQPDRYLTPALDSLEDIPAGGLGMTNLESVEWTVLYPGNRPEGGMLSFIQLEFYYRRTLDDCD